MKLYVVVTQKCPNDIRCWCMIKILTDKSCRQAGWDSGVDGLKFLPQLWTNVGDKKNKNYVYTRSKCWFHCNKWLFWVNLHSYFFLCQTIHQHHSQIFLSSTLLSERFEDAKCERLQSITFHLYWTVFSTVPRSKQRGEKGSSLKHLPRNVHSHLDNEICEHCEHSHSRFRKEFVVDGKVHIRDWFTLLTKYQYPI